MVVAEEEQADYPTPGAPLDPPKYTLYSLQPLGRRYLYTCGLAIVSTAVTSYSVYYTFNASLSSDPLLHLLWYSPNTTVFTLNLLAQLSTILLVEFTNTICEDLRWSTAGCKKGISMLSFLALGIATSPLGFVSLSLSGIWKACCRRKSPDWRPHDKSHGGIALQRCLSSS